QSRRGDRPAPRRRDGGDRVVGAAIAQRSRRAPPCLCRLARRRHRRRVLVHPTGLFSWRHFMRRGIVLGTVIAVGALSLAAAAYQTPPQTSAPKVIEVQKLKDNLFMLTTGREGGGNTAVFVTSTGVVVVDTKNLGWGQPILDKIKGITNKPVTTIINTHTHGDH